MKCGYKSRYEGELIYHDCKCISKALLMQLCKWLCGLNSVLIIYYIKMTDDILLRYDFYFENSVSGLTPHFFFLFFHSVRLRTSLLRPVKGSENESGAEI